MLFSLFGFKSCGSSQKPIKINEYKKGLTTFPTDLPASAVYLNYCDNEITELPRLSDTIQYIDFSQNRIINIVNIPIAATEVHLNDNALKSLPADISQATHLKHLYVSKNKLEALPAQLPDSIEWFWCNDNNLTSLPAQLPANIKCFKCYNNKIDALPLVLPRGLDHLNCFKNQLTTLPDLSNTVLTYFDCSRNKIEHMPQMPATLTELNFSDNPIKTFPDISKCTDLERLSYMGKYYLSRHDSSVVEMPYKTLPASLKHFTFLYAGIDRLPAMPDGLEWLSCGGNALKILPDLPETLTSLSFPDELRNTVYPKLKQSSYHVYNKNDDAVVLAVRYINSVNAIIRSGVSPDPDEDAKFAEECAEEIARLNNLLKNMDAVDDNYTEEERAIDIKILTARRDKYIAEAAAGRMGASLAELAALTAPLQEKSGH